MKTKLQLKKWGDSSGILISSIIKTQLNLKDKDYVDVEITKAAPIDREPITYRCRACNLVFDTSDETPYCPVCSDSPKIEEIIEK